MGQPLAQFQAPTAVNMNHHPLLSQMQGIRQTLAIPALSQAQVGVNVSASPSIVATTAASNVAMANPMVESYLNQGIGPIPGATISKGQQRFAPY